jgi:pyrophosphatase PpaX
VSSPQSVPSLRWPTVVFDLDGTLADTVELIVASYQHAFRTVVGHEEDVDVIKSWIGRTLHDAFTEYSPEHAEALVAAYLPWNDANTERLIRGYDGVRELLADLAAAGARIGVATSKRRSAARQAMDVLGLTEFVEVLVGMEDTSTHKPDPAPVLLAVDRLGGTPGRAVYVGDAVVDILAGQAAGTATIAVTWGAGHEESLAVSRPDGVAPDVSRLRSLLLP